jgi:hypothetical protein
MIVAIHQPNLFPWLGFFDKIYRCDKFVYLNHTENNPRTAIYTKRVKILVNKQEYWLTCNLKSSPDVVFMPINKMVLDKSEILKDKHLKTIELNYKKAPYFNEAFPSFQKFYEHPSAFISERNIAFINEVCDKLEITTPKLISDQMDISGSSNDLLVDIIKKTNGTAYMPGGGASGYQDDEMFTRNGIEIKPQNFKHPVYKQFNTSSFLAGLSILDALMNLGFEGTSQLIRNAG